MLKKRTEKNKIHICNHYEALTNTHCAQVHREGAMIRENGPETLNNFRLLKPGSRVTYFDAFLGDVFLKATIMEIKCILGLPGYFRVQVPMLSNLVLGFGNGFVSSVNTTSQIDFGLENSATKVSQLLVCRQITKKETLHWSV